MCRTLMCNPKMFGTLFLPFPTSFPSHISPPLSSHTSPSPSLFLSYLPFPTPCLAPPSSFHDREEEDLMVKLDQKELKENQLVTTPKRCPSCSKHFYHLRETVGQKVTLDTWAFVVFLVLLVGLGKMVFLASSVSKCVCVK